MFVAGVETACGDERVRAIFDASHFVQINNGITIRDRLEFPGPEATAETWMPAFDLW